MAFDNTEDSQHVYYLILPLHPTQVIYLSKKKENTMKAAKEHFPGSPKHNQHQMVPCNMGITYYKQRATFICEGS